MNFGPTYDDGVGLFLGLSAGIILFAVVFGLIMYAVVAYLLGKVFEKMNIEPWKAWVPIYNSWTFLEAGGFAGALALLTFVPFVGGIAVLVLMAMAAARISEGFGKESAWGILYFFLAPVWCGIIGLGSAQWMGLPNGMQPGGSSAAGSARPGMGGQYAQQGGFGQPAYGQQPYGQGNYNQAGNYGAPAQAPAYGAPGQAPAYGAPQQQNPYGAQPQQNPYGAPQQQNPYGGQPQGGAPTGQQPQ